MLYALYYSSFVLEALSLIMAIAFFYKYKNDTVLRLIPVYLFIICFSEFSNLLFKNRSLLSFNFTMPLECYFYYYLFYHHLENKKYKQITLLLVAIFTVAWLLELFILPNLNKTLVATSYSIGALGIIIAYILYLYDLLNRVDYIKHTQTLFFWIANGIFIFLIMTILKDNVTNHANELSMPVKIAIRSMQFIGSNLLYLSYIMGFIKCAKIKKSSDH